MNQPVLFRIAHAWVEGGGGREGKNGLAKLARFLKLSTEFLTDHKIGHVTSYVYNIHALIL